MFIVTFIRAPLFCSNRNMIILEFGHRGKVAIALSASVQPKPGFGIGNRNHDQVSVSVSAPELFLLKPKLSSIFIP